MGGKNEGMRDERENEVFFLSFYIIHNLIVINFVHSLIVFFCLFVCFLFFSCLGRYMGYWSNTL
jgi:hypothetical protein